MTMSIRTMSAAASEAWLDSCCRPGPGEESQAMLRQELARSFQWHDGLLMGNPIIDSDHQRFFAYFSVLARHVDAFSDALALEALFRDIVADLGAHLTTEERILLESGFPDIESHQNSHLLLAEQARAALAIGQDGEWLTALRLLATSVLEHITQDDAKMRPYLMPEFLGFSSRLTQ